jgi:ferric-dicitrate binding protein FerR (iron transport regulator)
VNTNRPDSLVEVILVTGRVALYHKDHPEEKTLMDPGEKVIISKQQNVATKTINTDKNYMAWKSGKLVFEDTPLDEVVRLLNKVYHTEAVLMQPDLAKCTITATFENQTADAVLHVIEETLGLDITRKGNQIQISGKSCSK